MVPDRKQSLDDCEGKAIRVGSGENDQLGEDESDGSIRLRL